MSTAAAAAPSAAEGWETVVVATWILEDTKADMAATEG